MTDQEKRISDLEAQVADLTKALKTSMLQHGVTYNLVLALAYQCSIPTKLRSDFAEISKQVSDRQLYSTLTEEEIEQMREIAKAVGKALPKAPE